jgi:hypothetical protein
VIDGVGSLPDVLGDFGVRVDVLTGPDLRAPHLVEGLGPQYLPAPADALDEDVEVAVRLEVVRVDDRVVRRVGRPERDPARLSGRNWVVPSERPLPSSGLSKPCRMK